MHLNSICSVLPSEVDDNDPDHNQDQDLEPVDHDQVIHKPATKTKYSSRRRRSCGGLRILESLHRLVFDSKWARVYHHRDQPKRQPSSVYHDMVGVQLTEKVGGGGAVARTFSYAELYIGSRGFSPDEVLGSGGFGKVYRAVLPSDGTLVAVKCLLGRGERFEKSFMAELVAVAHLRHRNLVRLRGWCVHEDQLLLVYDYMPNLSLDRLLFKKTEGNGLVPLNWERRVKIVSGLAAALFYLHEQLDTQIIHRDVKASNVMLDSDYNPRLGDFGLARWVEHELEYQTTRTPVQSHQFRLRETTRAGGTIGYLSPESFHSVSTAKSDVFSFGIVVLEVVSGRRAVDLTFPDDQIILLDWIRALSDEGMIVKAGDSRLKDGSIRLSEMEQLIYVGLLCTLHNPRSRPSMKWVVEALSGSLHGKFPSLPSFRSLPRYISVSSQTSSNSSSMTTTTNNTNISITTTTTTINTITTTSTLASNSSIFVTAIGESIYATAENGNGGDLNSSNNSLSSHNSLSSQYNSRSSQDSQSTKISQNSRLTQNIRSKNSQRDLFSMVDTAREMNFSDIVFATNNFSDSNRVADVDFGAAYQGILDNRYILVKRLNIKTPAAQEEYATELSNLGRLNHRNILHLRGWCTEQGEMVVIYDYATGHLLLTHYLFHPNRKNRKLILHWKHRYNIIKSIAYAIRYLHEEWEEQVILRGITAPSICIAPDMIPRLNSVALAEFLTRNYGHGYFEGKGKNDAVGGIFGYIAPEYMETGIATTMTDVYSFGVVMLEVVTGERAIDFRRPDVLLVQRIHEFERRKGRYEKLADPRLEGAYNQKELVRMVKLGMACTRSDPDVRPSMRKIVSILDGYDTSFMEEKLRKEGREEWKQKNACLLAHVKRGKALGVD